MGVSSCNRFGPMPQCMLMLWHLRDHFTCEAQLASVSQAALSVCVQAGIDPYDAKATAPSELVSFTNCFHGRTMGALTLTYKEQVCFD